MTMNRETVTLRATDGSRLAGFVWVPRTAESPRGVVILAHGMGEHIRRYDHVAAAFTRAGFVVYGFDHRGHGAAIGSDSEPGDLGPQGWWALIDDIRVVVTFAKSVYPGLPTTIVAHSMGSFATQQFLLDHGKLVDSAALIGTSALDLLEPALDTSLDLDLSAFNTAFAPARTDFDWLSRDEREVDTYIADPLCGFGINSSSVQDMLSGARRLADPEQFQRLPKHLALYVAVGSEDPVNGGLVLLWPLIDRYQKAGLDDVTVQVYAGARHEIFNETNKSEVIDDLLHWLSREPTPHRQARQSC